MRVQTIPNRNITNFDEFHLEFNPPSSQSSMVLAEFNNSHCRYENFGSAKDGTTVGLTIVNDGTYLKPFLLFKGKRLSAAVRNAIDHSFFDVSCAPEGNMRGYIFLEWIKTVRIFQSLNNVYPVSLI